MDEQNVTICKSYAKINHDFKICAEPKYKLPLVRLYYGPCNTDGFIKHKPQKFHSLVARLKNLDLDIELIPSAHLNVLKIIILGYEVYRMNLKYLQFNINCNFDAICTGILEKVQEATCRLYSDYNISKSVNLWSAYCDLSEITESESWDL